jgi:hypothetical protein
MSPHTSSMQRLTQLLLAILAVGVWGLLLRPYLPIAAAAAKSPLGYADGIFRYDYSTTRQCRRCRRDYALGHCQ